MLGASSCLGGGLDSEVQEDLLEEYGGQSKATMEKLGKQLGLKMSWAPRAQRRMLAKYVLASRRQTQDVPRISIAMDASRLGGKDCLCGVVICTSAVDKIVRAVWSPPQAFTKTHFKGKPKPKKTENEKFRKVPESSGKFRKVPESSGRFRKVPESSGKWVPESSGNFREFFVFILLVQRVGVNCCSSGAQGPQAGS